MTRCDACQGSGLRPIHVLTTYNRGIPGMPPHERKEIDAVTAASLRKIVDGENQRVDPYVKLCECEVGTKIRQARAARESKEEEKAHRGSRKS